MWILALTRIPNPVGIVYAWLVCLWGGANYLETLEIALSAHKDARKRLVEKINKRPGWLAPVKIARRYLIEFIINNKVGTVVALFLLCCDLWSNHKATTTNRYNY